MSEPEHVSEILGPTLERIWRRCKRQEVEMIRGEFSGECVYSETSQTGKQHTFVLKQDGGRYPDFVACKGFGKTLELTQSVRVGDKVRVNGATKSREWQGKWFTDFVVESLTVLNKAEGSAQHRDEKYDPRDDDVAF